MRIVSFGFVCHIVIMTIAHIMVTLYTIIYVSLDLVSYSPNTGAWSASYKATNYLVWVCENQPMLF